MGELTGNSEADWIRCIADQIEWDGAVVRVPSRLLAKHKRQGYDWRHDLSSIPAASAPT